MNNLYRLSNILISVVSDHGTQVEFLSQHIYRQVRILRAFSETLFYCVLKKISCRNGRAVLSNQYSAIEETFDVFVSRTILDEA